MDSFVGWILAGFVTGSIVFCLFVLFFFRSSLHFWVGLELVAVSLESDRVRFRFSFVCGSVLGCYCWFFFIAIRFCFYDSDWLGFLVGCWLAPFLCVGCVLFFFCFFFGFIVWNAVLLVDLLFHFVYQSLLRLVLIGPSLNCFYCSAHFRYRIGFWLNHRTDFNRFNNRQNLGTTQKGSLPSFYRVLGVFFSALDSHPTSLDGWVA